MKQIVKIILTAICVLSIAGCSSPKYVGKWETYFLNATMEIHENGTLTMDSGVLVEANWRQEGDHIVIDGGNITGTAKLSSDGKTLYLNNTFGMSLGNVGLQFEFYRVD